MGSVFDGVGRPADPLIVHESVLEGRVVVVVEGEIDLATGGILIEALSRAGRAGPPEVWVDMTAVTFMGSSGLRALMDAHAAFEASAHRLTVICPDGPIRRVFAVARVDTVLRIVPDREAAQLSD